MKRKRVKIRYNSSGATVMVPVKYAEILKRRGLCVILKYDTRLN